MRQGQETLDAIERNDEMLTELRISDCWYIDRGSNAVGRYDPAGEGADLDRLGDAIGNNTQLLTLEFYWNDDILAAFNGNREMFVYGLKRNTSIRRLNLEHCDISRGPGLEVLEVLGEGIGLLTTLYMHGRCVLGDEGIRALTSTLRK